jgi:hypothetical protein
VQRTKLRRSAGLPEIYFVVRSGRAQLFKPGFVRNSDEEADHRSTALDEMSHISDRPRLQFAFHIRGVNALDYQLQI